MNKYIKIKHYAQMPSNLQVMQPMMTTKEFDAIVRVDSIDLINEENGNATLWVAGKPLFTKIPYAKMVEELGIDVKEVGE